MKNAYAVITILVTITLASSVHPAVSNAAVENDGVPASESGVPDTEADTARRDDPVSHPDKPSHRASINPPDESSIEVRAFRFLNRSLANPFLDAIMPIITDLKRWRIVLLVVWSWLISVSRVCGV